MGKRLGLGTIGAIALLACTTEETPPDPPPVDAGTPEEDCFRCHGDRERNNNAPPPANWWEGDMPDSHQQHLRGASWRNWVECDDCHVVPAAIRDESHRDGAPSELVWSAIAAADGAAPAYDFATRTCTDVYCHGATLVSGVAETIPEWGNDTGASLACGEACHDHPPPPPHPAEAQCSDCHGDVIDENDEIKAAILHIDGVVSTEGFECNVCHGDASGDPTDPIAWAPPVDLSGNSDTSAPGVGAHQQHVGISDWHAPLECGDCHQVPASMLDDGHVDTNPPAELTWSLLATADGAAPAYDGTSCSNTYCHGGTLPAGGTNTTPIWTLVDGTQAQCGTCHGSPPPTPAHPFVRDPANCGPCHLYTGLSPDDPASHIDGVVDVVEPLACDSCHGNTTNDGPPTDTTGNSATTARGVGAHQTHLTNSTLRVAVPCSECHVVPTDWRDPGHRDTSLPAEVTFGPLATPDDGRTPTWNGTRCVNVYCHNPSSNDTWAANTEPIWTTVNGTQAACGTCHGHPPVTALHPFDPACSYCHPLVVEIDDITIKDSTLHVNGVSEWQ